MAYGKMQDTYQYWEKWNRKDNRVETYFLAQWEQQFNAIRRICKDIEKPENLQEAGFDHDEPYYSVYLGTIFSLTPSSKFYVPFASSNVSVKETAIDEFWWEKFREILEEESCWDECSEGCSSDIFICKTAPRQRPEDMTDEKFVEILQNVIMKDLTPADYLAIPGIYEILSEYYNNDVLDAYEEGI